MVAVMLCMPINYPAEAEPSGTPNPTPHLTCPDQSQCLAGLHKIRIVASLASCGAAVCGVLLWNKKSA